MTLSISQYVDLPPHQQGGFDHADVHLKSSRVYVAHTATGTLEIMDGENAKHSVTIPGCTGASGVICAQNENLVFAAARGSGKILVIDALTNRVIRETRVGSTPNGLAWGGKCKQLLVADVKDYHARSVDPYSGELIWALRLTGMPRWCAYSSEENLFLVNIREPAGVAILDPENMTQKAFLPISTAGPHGLDIDAKSGIAYVACDAGAVVVLDISTGRELAVIPIEDGPDVVWLNSKKHRLYCAVGKPGIIEVIDTLKAVVDEKINTEEGAHTLAFDEKRQRLYAFLPRTCRAAIYKET